jgi:hypothetical protein
MSVYGEFSDEERGLLRAGLEAAAVAVSAASPGRPEEAASEGVAAASFILERKADYVEDRLVSAVIADLEARLKTEQAFPDFVKVASAPGARDWAMGTLRDVASLLDAKAPPEDAGAYKAWLMRLATVVALAGKEDQGFLGRGGVKVNDAEQSALEDIAEALGTSLEGPIAT